MRGGDDRREKLVAITKAGTAKLAKARPAWERASANAVDNAGGNMAAPHGDPPGRRIAIGWSLSFFAQIGVYACCRRGQGLAASISGGAMSMQLEAAERAGGETHRAASLTPQARRLLEGPVLPTLLRLAAPTVVLMLLQGVIAAGEAAFVGRLGYHALAGVSPGFPLVMLMTTLSAGAYGGGVASGVARARCREGR